VKREELYCYRLLLLLLLPIITTVIAYPCEEGGVVRAGVHKRREGAREREGEGERETGTERKGERESVCMYACM